MIYDARYLSRGKRLDNGEWVVGYYNGPVSIVATHDICIKETGFMVEINPDTVGQCTGYKDKNGTLIFEGDIIGNFKPHGSFNPTVQFHDGAFWLADFHLSCCAEKAEIIGSIYDNPELMEV